MRRTAFPLLVICLVATFALTLRSQSSAPQTGTPAGTQSAPAATAQQPTAPAAAAPRPGGPPPFKNVKLLTDVPREQFVPTMAFMAGSLGVGCEFCHNTKAFDSDEKKEKLTARTMIQLTRDINQKFFDGKTEVTCQTCHRGSNDPVSRPEPTQAHWLHPSTETEEGQNQNLPSAEQLIQKYRTAVGIGTAPKVTSQQVQFSATQQDGRGSNPASGEISISGDKLLIHAKHARGDDTYGFQGEQNWAKDAKGVHPIDPRQISDLKDLGSILQPDQVGTLTQTRVRGKEKVNGRDAYVLYGKAEDGQMRAYYFDAENGLLLRKRSFVPTAFGRMPVDLEYGDYQTIGGYKLPQQINTLSLMSTIKRQLTSRKVNVPVDEKIFAQPAA